MKLRTIILSAALILIAGGSSRLLSQTTQDTATYTMPPVIVSPIEATGRETPATFSTMPATGIRERYRMLDAPALLADFPSVTHYSLNGNDIGYTFLNLRGFDQRRLAIMVNGIPQNDPEDHDVYWIDMPDLLASASGIQVQRGAGNAFYGPPAIGGSVNISTGSLAATPEVTMSGSFGFQELGGVHETPLNTRKYLASFSSGLIDDRYALTGRLSKISSAGYRLASWTDLTSYFFSASRYDPAVTTTINIYGGSVADGEAYYGLPKYYNEDPTLRRENYSFWSTSGDTVDYRTVQKPQAAEGFSQPHLEVLNQWKASDRVTLFNTLFYIQGDGYFDYDGDWIAYDPFASAWFRDRVGYDSTFGVASFPSLLVRGFVGNKQGGWLPRVEFDREDGSTTVGAELRIHRSIHWGTIAGASALPSASYDPDFRFYEYNGEKDMASLYVHEVRRVSQDVTLQGDLQLAYDRYGIRNEKFIGTDFDVRYLFLNPRAGLNWNIDERWNGYVAAAYTSREPRLRNLYAAEDAFFGATPLFASRQSGGYDFTSPVAQAEHLVDLEAGTTGNLDGAKVSASVYWMEFMNELVKSGRIDIFGSSILLNADRTRHVGIELEAVVRPAGDLTLEGNMSVSSNKIVRHRFFDTADSVQRVLDGNPIAGFPDVLARGRVRFGSEGNHVWASVRFVGSIHTDNLNDPANSLPSYAILDLGGSLRVPKLVSGIGIGLSADINNVLNKLYLAGGEGNAFFPAAERNYVITVTTTL